MGLEGREKEGGYGRACGRTGVGVRAITSSDRRG